MQPRKLLKRVPVESEAVRSVGYDPQTRVLQVEFENGAIYHYLDVPESEYQALLRAESIGRFVTYRIDEANYRHELMKAADESLAR
jgi:hypothetical protein